MVGRSRFYPWNKGYVNFRSDRKKRRRAKRCWGGIIIYCKNHITKGVAKLYSVSNDALWLELCKNHFGLEKDIFICTAYIPHWNSPYFKTNSTNPDHFDTMSREVELFSSRGNVAIIGDLNNRIGMRKESHYDVFHDNTGEDITRPLPVVSRSNQDRQVNGPGRRLMTLLNDYGLMVANGRTCGDLAGQYTCCRWNGMSAVDLLVVEGDFFRELTTSAWTALIGSATMPSSQFHWGFKWKMKLFFQSHGNVSQNISKIAIMTTNSKNLKKRSCLTKSKIYFVI